MTLQLGGGGAITGCTSLADPVLTLDGLVVGGTGRFEDTVTIGGTVLAPNITLNATDGSATFAGGKANISPAGVMYVSRDTGSQQIFGGGFGGDNTKYQVFADGSGAFKAKVTSASTVAGDGGTTLTTKDYVDAAAGGAGAWTQAGTDLYPTTTTSDVKIGGTLPSAPNITLAANGSGTMKGPLTIYNPSFSSLDIRSDRLTGTIGGFRFLDSTASNAASIYAYTQGVLSLQTLGNERARLDENGNFLLGDVLTGGAIVNPKIALNADGSATFANDVETAGVFISDRASAGATVFGGRENGVTKTQIYANGNATFAGTVTATVVPPSDARFKENITPAKPQLADVVALGGLLKNYDWTDEAPLNEELRSVRQLGLVAQEVAEVCPSLVKDINRTKTMEITPAVIGPKGRVITEAVTEEVDDSYKGLSQEALIMKLIGAVAELSAEVASLRSN